MSKAFSGRAGILLPLVFLFACAGCASSPPTRFYQLSSMRANSADLGETKTAGRPGIVMVGPVQIPDYLDRPQIVTVSGKNRLKLAEFDRWGGSLDKDTARVLVEDMSAFLPPSRFQVTPWTFYWAPLPFRYRVGVNIIRFEGAPGKTVLLKAQWVIYDKERRIRLQRESAITEEVRGNTYGSIVASMSRALADLGKEMAGSVMSLKSTEK